ncbi:B12-binding domain-containing radical SAM protein [Campylobacterota bacterium]|nr:B12-binding domain-containing radical SAM protein [Campylobacterota bacterium]
MKIALISPKGRLYRHTGGIFKRSLRYQPLTLTTLAALIPAELHASVELIDEGIAEIPSDLSADLVGITAITGTANRAYEIADRLRARGITVVLGGPHITLLPDEAAEHADAICVGYADQSWQRLLLDFAAGKLQKVYRQDADFTLVGQPFARRELFDRKHFLTQAVFEATRSCAHDCEFCVAPTAWGRQQYQKPIDWVIEDIRRYTARTGETKILFVDLNIISDKRYAAELFTALIPLGVQWFGLSTVLIAHDRSLMELMARSGCKGLLLGLETVSDSSLADAHKSFNASVSYRSLIDDLHHLGIAIQGCFVFGLDHDTTDVFDATVQFAIDAAIELPRFAVLTPFPATPLFKRLEAEGRILTRDWDLYDAQHVVFQPRNMSAHELASGHERAWREVYRWSAIGKRLWRARHLTPLFISGNWGYRFYARHLHSFYNCDMPMDVRWNLAWGRADHTGDQPPTEAPVRQVPCG